MYKESQTRCILYVFVEIYYNHLITGQTALREGSYGELPIMLYIFCWYHAMTGSMFLSDC